MTSPMREFVRESNRIEGILREPTDTEVDAHRSLLDWPDITVKRLEGWVETIAGAPLRREDGMDVIVGRYKPPRGGPLIEVGLRDFCRDVSTTDLGPYDAHVRYEKLHPFMDGNGRSGRAIWAWVMRQADLDPFSLPFLHRFYYQALDASRP